MKTTAIIRCVAACAAAVLLSFEVRAEKIDITAGAEYELASCGWPVAAHGDFGLAATLEFSHE